MSAAREALEAAIKALELKRPEEGIDKKLEEAIEKLKALRERVQ